MNFGQYSTFAFVDVETTGTSASQDRVLELGVIRVENGQVVGQMNTLLDPDVYIPPEITMITGIKGEDVLSAPHFSDVVDELEELLKDAIFVAHNARFDYSFIKHEFRRLSLPFNKKTLCTVKLSRILYPELSHHNLDAIISLLNVQIENRHRAYDDASVLHTFLSHVHSSFPPERHTKVIEELLKSPSLPSHISKKQINELPEGPGVYLMYGENDLLLYVGKSVDVKARVLSHFYNDFDSSKDIVLSKEVKRIDAIKTAGDFGASLLESNLIKTLLPAFNTYLRKGRSTEVLLETETKDGYYSVKTVESAKVEGKDSHKVLATVGSKRNIQAKLSELSKEYNLCPKLLGIEKTNGRCFASQIGVCFGACVGDEPTLKYNIRFVEAFSQKRVPIWPFPGAIAIKEKFEDIEEVHVLNNWCYLGSVKNEHESIEEIQLNKQVFDWDNYKIMMKFIKKKVKSMEIINLGPNRVLPSDTL